MEQIGAALGLNRHQVYDRVKRLKDAKRPRTAVRRLIAAQQIVRVPECEGMPLEVGDWVVLNGAAPPDLQGQVRQIRSVTMAQTARREPFRKWAHLEGGGQVEARAVLRRATEDEIRRAMWRAA